MSEHRDVTFLSCPVPYVDVALMEVTMATEERCNELREALTTARAQMEPPMPNAVDRGPAGVAAVNPSLTAPELSPELAEEVRRLEQALRDEGCEAD